MDDSSGISQLEDEEEEKGDGDKSNTRYIQAIVIKERDNDFPWQITCAASLLILTYLFKLFLVMCALSGCNCNGRCVCLS